MKVPLNLQSTKTTRPLLGLGAVKGVGEGCSRSHCEWAKREWEITEYLWCYKRVDFKKQPISGPIWEYGHWQVQIRILFERIGTSSYFSGYWRWNDLYGKGIKIWNLVHQMPWILLKSSFYLEKLWSRDARTWKWPRATEWGTMKNFPKEKKWFGDLSFWTPQLDDFKFEIEQFFAMHTQWKELQSLRGFEKGKRN